jgi:hypothetical protein
MRWVLWLASAVLVLLSGCSVSPESVVDTTTESTTTSPSSTTRESTTTTPVTTTTAIAPTTTPTIPPTTTMDVFYSIATHGLPPDPLPGSGEWFGSGCSPASDTLPDGIWWGYITDLSPSSITFDLACLRWIPDPDDDAFEDYAWVIENSNPRVRIVQVSLDTLVTCHWGQCPPNPLPHGEPERRREGGLWLYINNGVVTEIGDEFLAG